MDTQQPNDHTTGADTGADTGAEKPSAGLWPYLWLIVIGIAIIPNMIMLGVALSTNTASVAERPYEASKHYDEEKAKRHAFDHAGFTLSSTSCGRACIQLHLSGPVAELQDIELRVIRPADASLDRAVAWANPADSLELQLPAPGVWTVELHAKRGAIAVATILKIHGA